MQWKIERKMIEVIGLSKRFANKHVLKGLDIKVPPGEIVALLGANGAGKTTLLRILAALANPTLGKIKIGGHALPAEAAAARARIGFLGHKTLLYSDLSAEQNLLFCSRLYGVQNANSRVDEVLELVNLSRRKRDPVRIFSRGMLQRLAIGRAILHNPQVLLLDEAHTGLDQESAAMLNELLRSLANEGATILMASHDLERVSELANRVDVLVSGRIAASHSKTEMSTGSLARFYADALHSKQRGPRGN